MVELADRGSSWQKMRRRLRSRRPSRPAVALHNRRGVTPVTFPRGVRQLHGDRHDHAALAETLDKEEFDAVVDTSAYLLPDVESMVNIFRGRIGHYVFISSAASYAPPSISPISEES